MRWYEWVIVIAVTYILMTAVMMWSTSEENWNAGQPDHRYDVKMKFDK
jgi:hypothetical protein